MILSGVNYAAISGTILGSVATNNAGTINMRSKVKNVTSTSTLLFGPRGALKTVSQRWALLSDAQRAAWNAYAFTHADHSRLGVTRQITAHAMYNRLNSVRVAAAGDIAIVDDPPSSDQDTAMHVSGIQLTAANLATIIFDNTDSWAQQDFAYLICSVSRPKQLTQSKTSRYASQFAVISGSATAPPIGPVIRFTKYLYQVGQSFIWRMRVTTGNGTLGPILSATSTVM